MSAAEHPAKRASQVAKAVRLQTFILETTKDMPWRALDVATAPDRDHICEMAGEYPASDDTWAILVQLFVAAEELAITDMRSVEEIFGGLS